MSWCPLHPRRMVKGRAAGCWRRGIVAPFFFFFQAEDGIRDVAVTGVQTCALPISYADPTSQQVQSGGAYVPSTGLEAWTPSFPPTLSAWLYDPETNQWHEQLDGDLAFISNLPPTLSPGQALYVQTASTVSLNIPDPALRIRYYHRDHLGSSSVITDASGAIVEET